MPRTYDATQNTIAAATGLRHSWLFTIVTTAPVTYRRSTKGYSYGGNTFTEGIQNSFAGISLQRGRSGFNMHTSNSLKFVMDNKAALTASDFVGASVLVELVVSDGTNEEVMASAKYRVKVVRSLYQTILFECMDYISDKLDGEWPNTPLVKDLFPADDAPNPVLDNMCVPITFGTAYIPLRSVYVDSSFTFVDGDVTVAADSITENGHTMETGHRIKELTTTGTLPGGLAVDTPYWVIKVDANTIKLASTYALADAGTPVTITSAAGGGTHTASQPARHYVIGFADSETYTIVKARSPHGQPKSEYAVADIDFIQSTKVSGTTNYRVIQAITSQSVTGGAIDVNGLWLNGDHFLDLPVQYSRASTAYINGSITGTHDGGDNQALLTDSGESWTADAFIGAYVVNRTTGAYGLITDNDGTTVTATLSSDDWDDGDTFTIGGPASIIRYIMTDATEGMGFATGDIDDAAFGAAEAEYATWATGSLTGLQWNGGFFFKEARGTVLARLLNQCHSFFEVGETIALKVLSKTSVSTLTTAHVVENSMRWSSVPVKETDSGYAWVPISGEPQDRLFPLLVSALPSVSATYVAPTSTREHFRLITDTEHAQDIRAANLQRTLLKNASVTFKATPSQLKIMPEDVITLNDSEYGPSTAMFVDSVKIGTDLAITIKAYATSSALQDYADMQYAAQTFADHTDDDIPTSQIVTAGPAGPTTSTPANTSGVTLSSQLVVEDTNVNTNVSYDGITNYHKKKLGNTGDFHNFTGISNDVDFDQTGGECGDVRGIANYTKLGRGTTDATSDLLGLYQITRMDGGVSSVVGNDVKGISNDIDLLYGTISGDAYGIYNHVDISSNMTVISGNVYGIYSQVDDDEGAVGTVYNLYLDNDSGVDYAIYSDGTAEAYIAGEITTDTVLRLKERAASLADEATYGQVWVKTGTPCELWFTADDGTDTQIV
jgi:hypothetical protein